MLARSSLENEVDGMRYDFAVDEAQCMRNMMWKGTHVWINRSTRKSCKDATSSIRRNRRKNRISRRRWWTNRTSRIWVSTWVWWQDIERESRWEDTKAARTTRAMRAARAARQRVIYGIRAGVWWAWWRRWWRAISIVGCGCRDDEESECQEVFL